MDYADDQLMDNLIRGKNGLPIVHYDFGHATSTVTSKLAGTVGGGQTLSDTPRTLGAGGLFNAAARTAMRPFTFSVSPEQDNAIDVQVTPVLKERQIYEAYVAFLNARPSGENIGKYDSRVTTMTESNGGSKGEDANDEKFRRTSQIVQGEPTKNQVTTTTVTPPHPKAGIPAKSTTVSASQTPFDVDFDRIDSVRESATPPDPSEVLFGARLWKNGNWQYVAKKWRDGHYYWVPKTYRKAFFKLSLATVARSYASPSAAPAGGGGSAASSPAAAPDAEQLKSSLDSFSTLLRQQNLQLK